MMLNILFWPVRFAFSVAGWVLEAVLGLFGWIIGLFGTVIGLVFGLAGLAIVIAIVVGIVRLVKAGA